MKDQLEPEIAGQWQEINRMAQVLEINAPVGTTTAEERRQWLAWWKLSYESALTTTDEDKAYLKNGGWWPPLSAHMVGPAPQIVLRTSRPGLYADLPAEPLAEEDEGQTGK